MKLLNLILLLMMPCILLAQNSKISSDYTVTTGTPYAVVDAGIKEYISLKNGHVYMAKFRGGTVTTQKYDVDNMKEVTKYVYEDLPEYAKFQEFLQIKNRVFLIYEAFNKPEDTFTLYARELNPEDGSLKEQNALLTSSRPVKNSDIIIDMSNKNSHNILTNQGYKFLIEKSQDESKILVHFTLAQISKRDSKNYDEVGFYAFDGALNKLWGTEVKMPYTEAEMDNLCYAVTNNGEAKLIINNHITSSYNLFIVDKTEQLEIIDLNLSTDRLVSEFRMQEDPNGNLITVGFYANGIDLRSSGFTKSERSYIVNGLLYFSISKMGEVEQQKTFDFTEELIQQNLSKSQKKATARREKRGKAGIKDLNLTDFFIKEDGSVYCVGERQYIITTVTYTPNGTSARGKKKTEKVYYYGNMVVIKIASDGELAWMKKLAKNQFGKFGLGQMSFTYMETKNADYVAYIDNPKNIDLDAQDGVPAKHKDQSGGFLTTYKIDHETGKLEKHTLMDLDNVPGGYEAHQFKTARIINCGNDDFLLEIYIKGKEDTMVKFHVN